MATATARIPETPEPIDAETKGVNRREFLQYVWGASIALLLTESCGAITWFALPRYRNLAELGLVNVEMSHLSAVGAAPIVFSAGKCWLSNTDKRLLALSEGCVKDFIWFHW